MGRFVIFPIIISGSNSNFKNLYHLAFTAFYSTKFIIEASI